VHRLIDTKRILVCAGPGGVGKTTTAAALAVAAARAGRRTLVCTIDPAPRLADALGMPDLSADPRPLSDAAARALGIHAPGALMAARLDTARTFDRLVESEVPGQEMRRRIFANAIYREITSTLTGSQEYAATLALHELHTAGGYDLIVLDTPPTAHALDFLEAPRRLTAAIESPIVQWFSRPPSSTGLLSWQRLRAGPGLILRRVGKLVGSQFLDDLGAFLLDFRDVLHGFLRRAQAVEALLRQQETGFLLVLEPEVPAVSEALFFAARLREAGLHLEAFIANRVLPVISLTDEPTLRERLTGCGARPLDVDAGVTALAALADHLARLASAQRRELVRLHHEAPGVALAVVPLLAGDVSTLDSLRKIGEHLVGKRDDSYALR